jgi:YjbE family integral membrane protein
VPSLDFDLLRAVFSIVVIDLVLSGDNAVVIGMAAHALPPRQQRQAIIWGAAGAIGLRVLFTAMAAVLLGIPLLQAVGGAVLIWIALKLLRDEEQHRTVKEGATLFEAIRTIVLADVVMSLDNILAVGGAAHGNLALLLFGLALSMPIILFGSGLVAALMNRLPWLVYLGAAVLVYTGVEMILKDAIIRPLYPHETWFEVGVIVLIVAATIGLAHWLNTRRRSEPEPTKEPPVQATSE